MSVTLIIAELALKFLPLITTGAEHVWNFITSVRSAAQQTGEWTPAAEAAYQQRLLAKADAPQSQPDAPV